MKCKLLQKIKFKLLNKKYFLKYAMPCLIAKVSRGELSKEEYQRLIKNFENGKKFSEDELWVLFNYAIRKLLVLGIEENKVDDKEVIIDKNIIKKYFWFEHPQAVLLKNADIKNCLVLPGKIIKKLNQKEYIAETLFGKRKIKSWQSLKAGDFATIHYNYACEKINEEDYLELKKFLEGII